MMENQMRAQRKHQKKDGFTLVEIAISLIILGVMITPLLLLYNNYKTKEGTEKTYNNVQQAIFALEEYRGMTGRYPCPAGLNLPRDSSPPAPVYGAEHCPDISVTSAGQCDNGVCVERSVRDVGGGNFPLVLVGSLPFRQLQVDEGEAIDAYNNRLVYAVTQNMTLNDGSVINDAMGGIDVRSPEGESLVTPAGSASFLVFSAGPSRSGAFSTYGNIVDSCANASPSEQQNCNPGFEDPTNGSEEAIYVSAFKSTGSNDQYDDVMQFFSSYPAELWRTSNTNPDDIRDQAVGNIGVGTNQPTTTLDIVSSKDSLSIFGTDGSDGILYTDQICDENGSNCFEPSDIGSTEGISCPAGSDMVGIAGGKAICEETLTLSCPLGTPVLKGLDGSGNPICIAEPNASCEKQKVDQCPSEADEGKKWLPQSAHGDVVELKQGSCAKRSYRCDNGTWTGIGQWAGQCVYAANETRQSNLDCGLGRAGTYTSITTYLSCGTVKKTVTTKFDDPNRPQNEPADCLCENEGIVTTGVQCDKLASTYGIKGYEKLTGTADVQTNYAGCKKTGTTLLKANCSCIRPTSTPETQERDRKAICGPGQTPVAGTWKELWKWNEASCQMTYVSDLPDGQCVCSLKPDIYREPVDCVETADNPSYPYPKCWQATYDEYEVRVVTLDGKELPDNKQAACRLETPEEFKARPPKKRGECNVRPFVYDGPYKNAYEGDAPGSYVTIGSTCSCKQDGEAPSAPCFNAGVNFSDASSPRLLHRCKCMPK